MMEPDRLLRRERAVVGAAAALLALLAWIYLWQGAGMGMSMLDMTELALFPHARPEPMPGMDAPPFIWSVTLAMWWIMMIAMMVPSALPLVLLYGRVVRHASATPARSSRPAGGRCWSVAAAASGRAAPGRPRVPPRSAPCWP